MSVWFTNENDVHERLIEIATSLQHALAERVQYRAVVLTADEAHALRFVLADTEMSLWGIPVKVWKEPTRA